MFFKYFMPEKNMMQDRYWKFSSVQQHSETLSLKKKKKVICKASYMNSTHGAKKHHFYLLLVGYFLTDKFGPKLPVHES